MYPDRLNIDPTKRSPWILLEPGRIFVFGRSIIDKPSVFFEPGLAWLSDFTKNWTGKTNIVLGFEYINSGSIKWLYILFRQFSEIMDMPDNVVITWYYEKGDDDLRELGLILRSLVECTFTLVEVEQMNLKLYEELVARNN
jgi:hypothetical protein